MTDGRNLVVVTVRCFGVFLVMALLDVTFQQEFVRETPLSTRN